MGVWKGAGADVEALALGGGAAPTAAGSAGGEAGKKAGMAMPLALHAGAVGKGKSTCSTGRGPEPPGGQEQVLRRAECVRDTTIGS